jgi:hypothetical protein
MKAPSAFGLDNLFSFSQDYCEKYDLPPILYDLKASTWLDQKYLAKKSVELDLGAVDSISSLTAFTDGLQKLKKIKDLEAALKDYLSYAISTYKREPAQKRFYTHFQSELDALLLKKAQKSGTSKMMADNFNTHAQLSSITSKKIAESAS